jgi:hypothetical protein
VESVPEAVSACFTSSRVLGHDPRISRTLSSATISAAARAFVARGRPEVRPPRRRTRAIERPSSAGRAGHESCCAGNRAAWAGRAHSYLKHDCIPAGRHPQRDEHGRSPRVERKRRDERTVLFPKLRRAAELRRPARFLLEFERQRRRIREDVVGPTVFRGRICAWPSVRRVRRGGPVVRKDDGYASWARRRERSHSAKHVLVNRKRCWAAVPILIGGCDPARTDRRKNGCAPQPPCLARPSNATRVARSESEVASPLRGQTSPGSPLWRTRCTARRSGQARQTSRGRCQPGRGFRDPQSYRRAP